MEEKFNQLIVGVVYHPKEDKFLVTKRKDDEQILPGIYSFTVGEISYHPEERIDVFEHNLTREFKDEVDIEVAFPEYLTSFQYLDDEENKVSASCFLAFYRDGEAKVVHEDELESVSWMEIDEIRNLETTPMVHEIYEKALLKLHQRNRLHHLAVAGIVINDNNEFLLIPEPVVNFENHMQTDTEENTNEEIAEADEQYAEEAEEYFTFVIDTVEKVPGATWEMLEKNLNRAIAEQAGLEIKDGAIPFTDQSLLQMDGFDQIVQYFICKFDHSIEANREYKFVKFEDLGKYNLRPSVAKVFEKAAFFIEKLSTF